MIHWGILIPVAAVSIVVGWWLRGLFADAGNYHNDKPEDWPPSPYKIEEE